MPCAQASAQHVALPGVHAGEPTRLPVDTGAGIEWIIIDDVDNPPVTLSPGWTWPVVGRGAVPYVYRIGKYEVTTAQWLEFLNTFGPQGDEFRWFARPGWWGADIDFTYNGPGVRYVLLDMPSAEMMPVFGISWRDAARFCNWLHNDKSSDPISLESGAYDTSTFGYEPDGRTFTDQVTRSEGARFWIPSWDEWLKAAHYDPQARRWYKWPTRDGRFPLTGLPGAGDTSAGVQGCEDIIPYCPYFIPLGAYESTSPWGLYDVSDGTREWTEETIESRWRMAEGARAGESQYEESMMNVDGVLAQWSFGPDDRAFSGLRVAGAIVTPAFIKTKQESGE